jgi:large-conductance mechanosensitive channel
MDMTGIKDYMAKIDYGQTLHRATNYLITGLVSIVLYFVVKMDKKLDSTSDKVDRHETRIEVHDNRISNINTQLGEIKQRQELRERGLIK